VVKEAMMNKSIELKNIEIKEFCLLNTVTGKIKFSTEKSIPGFTGLYYKDDVNFFALYPTPMGPYIYYLGKEYEINKDLSISVIKETKRRKFIIRDYDIQIEYKESQYIGVDIWSEEIDVDLFFMIEQRYQEDEFYDQYTKNGIN
jgi:hypothetical protein